MTEISNDDGPVLKTVELNGRWYVAWVGANIVVPIGFCSGMWTQVRRTMRGVIEDNHEQKEMIEKNIAICRKHRERYHSNGHRTEDKAVECYELFKELTGLG